VPAPGRTSSRAEINKAPISTVPSTRKWKDNFSVLNCTVFPDNSDRTRKFMCLKLHYVLARLLHLQKCLSHCSSRLLGMKKRLDSDKSVACTRTQLHACFFSFLMILLFLFPTDLRSCNGHAPLLVQEGRARAGQNVQQRRDGQYSYLNSSLAQGSWKKI
jgi:hypothetical protein